MADKNVKPKFIVLDSNVFIGDYWLRSPSFVLLREFLNKTKATLVVPKIVFEEVVNHHKEDVEKLESNARKLLGAAGRLLRNFEQTWSETISKKAAADSYEKFLSAALDELKTEVPHYKDIPHDQIVRRDLERRRPFQESGKGYRDTLLWETLVRHCAKKDALTVLITDNIQDFYDTEGEIHWSLRRDLAAKVKDVDAVALSRSLPIFTDTYIVPYLTKRKDFVSLVQHDKVQGLNLEEVSERNVDTIVKAIDDDPSVMIDDDSYEPSVDVIEGFSDFEAEEVSEVTEGILLVIYRCVANVLFTYFVPHGDYYSMSEQESTGIYILDPAWNEHVMWVESSRDVVIRSRLTFNTKKKMVESFEVEEVTSV